MKHSVHVIEKCQTPGDAHKGCDELGKLCIQKNTSIHLTVL